MKGRRENRLLMEKQQQHNEKIKAGNLLDTSGVRWK